MQIDRFRRLPLLGILRGIGAEDVAPLIDVVAESGLESIEITMNTADAPALIRRARELAANRIAVGAGTVLDLADLDRALDAGATFIVLPGLVPDVVARCAAERIAVFPGALTPQEIFAASRAGASMVKVFPAGAFGARYLKEIKGPFPAIELLACGGINADNMAEYFACGASAVAFGASVFRPDWLAARDYGRIGSEVRRLVEACRASREASG